MNKIFLGVVIIAVVGAGWFVYQSEESAEVAAVEHKKIDVADVKHVAAEAIEPEASAVKKDLPKALQVQFYDRVLGNPNAPVQIVEYASMTCGHCATFHTEVYPELKKEFIDTGKVSFIFRPLPWDDLALAVSQVAFCAAPASTPSYVSAFFETHASWVRSKKPLEEIKRVARLGGMGPDQVEKCIMDEKLRNLMQEIKRGALEDLKVKSTPTLFINETRLEGVHRMPELRKAIESYAK